MSKIKRALLLLIYKNYSKNTMKTDKSNNFLQIYYYRRAATCYPNGLRTKKSRKNFLTKLLDKLCNKSKKKLDK